LKKVVVVALLFLIAAPSNAYATSMKALKPIIDLPYSNNYKIS
jgi:hypothetical protein